MDDPAFDMSHLCVDPAALKGPDDPLLDALDGYLDSVLPSQWLPSPSGLPALADLRPRLSGDFAALGEHLCTGGERLPGWEQDPARSVPHLVVECATAHARVNSVGSGADGTAARCDVDRCSLASGSRPTRRSAWQPDPGARTRTTCTGDGLPVSD
ncbi:hypothetical protein, partial [Streptomyces sp. NPDC127084]|uniref:hypothetical protein n=1 Tax=Streptomyces sp. NPDC127084 TaxID=3347133 RepID=UPI00365F9F41